MIFLNKISKELKVGLFATTALTILYVGSSFFKGHQVFSSNCVYYVTYANSKGIGTASPVLLNGVVVGNVKQLQILPEQEYSVLVTFEVQQHITLTDNTTAILTNSSFLGIGGKAIELTVKKGNPLKHGSTIQGKIAQELGEILDKTLIPGLNAFEEPILVAGQLQAKIIENLNKIDGMFEDLETTRRFLKKIVHDNHKSVGQIGQTLLKVSDTLTNSEKGIQPVLTALNEVATGIESKDVRENMKKITNILNSLEKVLETTEEKDNLYCKVNNTLTHLDDLIVDMKKNPSRYVRFSVFGR